MELELDSYESEASIDRRDTGLRILYSLVLWLAMSVVEGIVGVLVLFELAWTLITCQEPPARLRDLGNRLVAYGYRVGRYLTYNEGVAPFPFDEFPPALEAPREVVDAD